MFAVPAVRTRFLNAHPVSPMSLSPADLVRLLAALVLLLVAVHGVAYVFGRLRQPPVIGEIVGGLLLGPTVLGRIDPSVVHALFGDERSAGAPLGALYQFGLLALMFLAGGEVVRAASSKNERSLVASITVAGLVVPLAAGLLVVTTIDTHSLVGPHGSRTAFALVFACAIAVTSVPVISRIMLDLGILDTPFARIVLSVAVLEDVALYALLAVILALAQASSGATFGLWASYGVPSTALSLLYYVSVTCAFFAVCISRGARVFRWLTSGRMSIFERYNPTALRLVFLLALALCCLGLGINPIFGALVAGMSVSRADAEVASDHGAHEAWDVLRRFSLAFFVPIYFGLVGVQLDLVRHFDPVFFAWFFLLACAAKSASVWAGARLAGESGSSSVDLAAALNARGGPGIVLASVTYGAGIISEDFFTALVVLSILTSQLAGFWLDLKLRTRERARVPEPVPVLARVGRSVEP
jgi:Kef-type K+ transport system membrane component KefB